MIQRSISGPRNYLSACERTPRAVCDELTAPEIAVVHAAADADVMKAAAENMNLVSLIGGKSPIELFTRLLEGTPLARTVRSMRRRDEDENRNDTQGRGASASADAAEAE